MSISLRTKYLSIKKDKLSETAKGVLKSMYDATDGFKDVKATRKIKPKFEAFYDKLVKAKPEAIKGATKPKETSAAKQFREARERRKSQAGVPKKQSDIERDADRPAIDRKGKRVTDGTHYPYVKGNVYYEYRDNRYDKRPAKYPKLEDGGMMAKGGMLPFENSNLYLNGFGMDSNGNSVVKVSFPNQRGFSIQTNGVLVETNNLYTKDIDELTDAQKHTIEKEVVEYVKKFGSDEQKKRLKTYSSYADGGMMSEGGLSGEQREFNKEVRKMANNEGFTPSELGKEYPLIMSQAIVEALTDANFHTEARVFISLLEKKPEWANKPEYGTEEYKEWEKSGVYQSKYWDADEKTRDFAIKVSQLSGWDGYSIAQAFEFTIQIDGGYHQYADKLKQAMESRPKMAKGGAIDYSKQTSDDFKLGEIVWDTDNKRYGTIIGIYNEYPSDKYEVRLETDGMQPTENLRKVGSKGDKGTKEQLNERIEMYAKLVKRFPENNYPQQLEPNVGVASIPNNYEGMTDKELWDTWNFKQKVHFLEDHWDEYNQNGELRNRSKASTARLKWEELPNLIHLMVAAHKYEGQYAHGGMMENGGEVKVVKVGDDTFYLTYIDSTHFYLSNSPDFKGTAYHIGQFRGSEPQWLWNDVKSWLKSNSGKKADGGMMADGGMIYKMADNMTDAEYEEKLSSLNEKQKKSYESLVRLGDSPKLALATTLLSKEVKWDDETERAYTMAKGGELATYRILEKHKYALQPKWEVEKFQTGGREFLTFKQAQDFKNKLQGMSSSFEYKVEKIPTTKIDQSKIYYMANGGETHRSQGGDIFADGGEIEKSNVQMVMSNTKAIEHHAEELKKLVDMDTPIEAWVVAKLERAETDLSDVTHYIDGLKSAKFADGGELEGHDVEIFYNTKDKVADPYTIIIDGSVFSMSGTSGPYSVNLYVGEIDEFSPQAVKGWGKKINFVNADPELIKQIETRFED